MGARHPQFVDHWVSRRVRTDDHERSLNNGHMRLLLVSLAICMFALFSLVVVTTVHVTNESDQRRNEQISGCERANLLRAEVNLLLVRLQQDPSHTQDLYDIQPLVINDCEKIIK